MEDEETKKEGRPWIVNGCLLPPDAYARSLVELSPEAQEDLVRQCATARMEEVFVEHVSDEDYNRAAKKLAADYEKILWQSPVEYVLYQESPIFFRQIKTRGINPRAIGGFLELDFDESTPTLEPVRSEPIKEAEIVSSCPPPLKSDYDKRMERAADLLRSPGQEEVHLRQPVPGKRCYVCDHAERAVAPSRISGALLCVLCAMRFVAD